MTTKQNCNRESTPTYSNSVKAKYRYWRWRTFISMYLGYMFFYFTRNSFNYSQPFLVQELGFSKPDLGVIATSLALSYAIGKFLAGLWSDRANPRYFMSLALIGTGITNLFFGSSNTVVWFLTFTIINGCLQGGGFPPCAKLLTHWYSRSERGTWWGFWNTSHNLGGWAIGILVAYSAAHFGWRWGMYVPGMISIVVGIVLILMLRDTPESMGLPDVEEFRGEEEAAPQEKKISVKEALFKYVLNNKYVWILSFAYFFVYAVRQGINGWSALFLIEQKGYVSETATIAISWFEWGGLFGSLASGWLSDTLFKGHRGPINFIFMLGVFLSVFLFWICPKNIMIDSLIMFSVGFMIFGPQMLIGVAVAEFTHKKAAGTATGFASGCFAYLGAAMAGYPLSHLIQQFGWEYFFYAMLACSLAALAFLFIPLMTKPSVPNHGLNRTSDST